MKIGSIGYNYSHDSSFIMDKPHGVGTYLLLLIKEPAVFEIRGVSGKVKKNSFVLLAPTTPCKYYADGEIYTDDWIFFEWEEGLQAHFAELGIPVDKVIHMERLEELSRLVHILAFEHYSADPHQEEIQAHYIEILLLKLSTLIQRNGRDRSCVLSEKNYRFAQLRNHIYTQPQQITDVNSMAAEMGMSRSGFQHLYKKIFGVGVMQDIMNSRVSYAKQLLSETSMCIRQIAERCGYTSEYSFMRQFKKQTGKTPSEYRSSI